MATIDPTTETAPQRAKRADAQRNYDKLIAAAREVFSESDANRSSEEIARRAGVGIGTLYRNFPTRQDLLEAVYILEFQTVSAAAEHSSTLPPWEGLVDWLHSFVGYYGTKKALGNEMLTFVDLGADVFKKSRAAIYAAGEPLLERAIAAGVVRSEVDFADLTRLVGGIAAIPGAEPGQIERILDLALDGLRYEAPAS